MPEGLRCLIAVAEKHGFNWDFQHFDFASCDYYDKHGEMLPKNWVEVLKPFDAIYFGAVGDPRRAPVSFFGKTLRNVCSLYSIGSYHALGEPASGKPGI